MNIVNRLLVLTLAVLFVGFGIGTAYAAPSVVIDPASSSVAGAGESFSVDVLVDPAGETLAGGTVELSFNSDVLSITSHSKGTIFSCESSDMGSDWTTAGYAKINLAALGCTATTAGTWANITFKVADDASDGVYDIGITSAVLKDQTTAVLAGTTTTNGTVTVGGAAPTLDTFTVTPTTVEQGGTVDIDIAFSTEVSWAINVNNSTATVETWSGTSTNPTEKHWVTTTGTPTGDYTVDVFMNDVLVDSKTVTVTEAGAANQPPTAVIASPTASGTYREGTEVSFLSTGSTDPDGTIVSYNWTFGDGNTSTLANTTHIYATADTYTVTLTVTDDDGATNSTTVTVTVSPAIVQINSWTLPSTGTRGTAIDATVTIENTGTETLWFVVSVAGTSTTGESIVGLGTAELDAGATKAVPVKIPVPGDADAAGTYTLYPDIYTLDGYPGTLQATGSGDTIVIS